MNDAIPDILCDPRLGLSPGERLDESIRLFTLYLDEWEKWNPRINLTADRDRASVLRHQVFESLLYARALRPGWKVADVGSGGGFPGIPLKIVEPSLDMILVESQRKKANFLRSVTRVLDLPGLEVIHGRAEEVVQEIGHRFDCVLFRAVGSLAECLTLAEPFLFPGGRVVIKKEREEGKEGRESSMGNLPLSLTQQIPVENQAGVPSTLLIFSRNQ
ncbi:MAG: 16S rRNA (guanine(527)-N(7))-methyltransferase RsmG [Nitrospinae bacterium CG11_big_fil_rev_8_21_14_0_20_56_8]|nr:MAG: 16S rRNA (guanine(527)-N(7))-methyltransferase RsmG [Nitrospinae bacterium CG11_big_fil_rev_8_21_14_0_20_56_8]